MPQLLVARYKQAKRNRTSKGSAHIQRTGAIQPHRDSCNGTPQLLNRSWFRVNHALAGCRLSYATRGILSGMTLSARNRLEGKIVELQFGGVMAHVVVRAGKNLIESVITKRSADEMKLKVGDTVSAVIKSTEVMLEKD